MVVCQVGSVAARHAREHADRVRRLAAQAEKRACARGDVVSDGDRRRGALGVEHGTRGDVDVAGDVDHSTGHDVAHTRNGDAGVVPRGDAGEAPSAEITTRAGVDRLTGGSAGDTCGTNQPDGRSPRQRHHQDHDVRDTKPHACSLRLLCHEKEAHAPRPPRYGIGFRSLSPKTPNRPSAAVPDLRVTTTQHRHPRNKPDYPRTTAPAEARLRHSGTQCHSRSGGGVRCVAQTRSAAADSIPNVARWC